jgi:hypothetical protein
MSNLTFYIFNAILIGMGATLTLDLWALFLKYAFKTNPSNFCLVGRWLRYMPEGTFRHSNIASVPSKSAECAIGWLAHYMVGFTFAITFVAIVGNSWLQHPTQIPAILFGTVTVLVPFFIMQPLFGQGIASSKMSNPSQARFRSLMNHTVFGTGLYLFALLANRLLQLFA